MLGGSMRRGAVIGVVAVLAGAGTAIAATADGITVPGSGVDQVAVSGATAHADVITATFDAVAGELTVTADTPITVTGTCRNAAGPRPTVAVCPSSLNGGRTLDGGDGNDQLTARIAGTTDETLGFRLLGGDGSDALDGSSGQDFLDVGAGADTTPPKGGAGLDQLSYADATRRGPVAVTLNGQPDDGDCVIAGGVCSSTEGDNIGDATSDIEMFIGGDGGFRFDGDVTGGPVDRIVYGGAGDDVLVGGAGNDTLGGLDGADHLSGGPGRDVASFIESRAGPINVSLGEGTSVGTSSDRDTLDPDIEGIFANPDGGTYTGNSQDNQLFGSIGPDTLLGRAGNDDLAPGPGDDLVDGGPGTDTLLAFDDAVTVDLQAGTATSAGSGSDTIAGVERVVAGPSDDVLKGADASETLYGHEGNDQIDGRGGADVVDAGPGDDTIEARDGVVDDVNCGPGTDTVTADAADSLLGCEAVQRVQVAAPPPPADQPAAPVDQPPATATSRATPPQPDYRHSVVVTPTGGKVLVKRPGQSGYTELGPGEEIPVGSIVDATHGRVRLTARRGPNGELDTAEFYEGRFRIEQPIAGDPFTRLVLVDAATGCATTKKPSIRRGRAAAKQRGKGRRPHLWGDGTGRFQTKGRFGAATVRGTKWLVEERCEGTFFRTARGVVDVRDDVKKKTTRLPAPRTYLARRG